MTNLQIFNQDMTRLLSKQQTAERLGISLSTLDRLMNANKINFVRVSLRRICFRTEDITEYELRNSNSLEANGTHKNASAIAV